MATYLYNPKDIVESALKNSSVELIEFNEKERKLEVWNAWEVRKSFEYDKSNFIKDFFEYLNEENKGFWIWKGESDLKGKIKEAKKLIEELAT